MKKFVAVLGVALIAVVVWKFVLPKGGQPVEEEVTPQLADDAAIYMKDQAISREMFVQVAQLSANGFVVVLDATESGSMGSPIGASLLLTPGKHDDISVMIDRDPVNAEKFFAMLYADTNNNGVFDAAADLPIKDKADNRVYAMFYVSSSRH